MTLPVVYDACHSSPDTEFFYLTRPLPANLFVNPPANLRVLTVGKEDSTGVGAILRLAIKLKHDLRIDVMIDLHDVLRTQLLRSFMWVRGVKVCRLHKGRGEKAKLTRKNRKVMRQLTTGDERYRRVFISAGIPLLNTFTTLYGNGKGDESLFASATMPKKGGERWIAIAPFAAHKGKIYPMDKMRQVVDSLALCEGVKLFLMGAGKCECEILESMRCGRESIVNMADKALGLSAELSLMSHCDVMISMDSANMHLASLVGLRTVSIWGATHPYCGFLGRGQSSADVVQLTMDCRPCSVFGNKPCLHGDYRCMANITPEQIISHIEL
jgi:ADP-heptose:LPS heptosyltransferase